MAKEVESLSNYSHLVTDSRGRKQWSKPYLTLIPSFRHQIFARPLTRQGTGSSEKAMLCSLHGAYSPVGVRDNEQSKKAKSLRTVIRRRRKTNVAQWSRAGGGDLPQVQGSEEASEEEFVAEPGRRREAM